MVTGTQIALQFPETSPPPLISVEEVHVVRDELPLIPPTTHAAVQNLETLQDLLDSIAATDQQQSGLLAMLQSTAVHLCTYLKQPPDKIAIEALGTALEGFRSYLRGRRFKRNSVRSYMNYAQLLLRKARNLGWSEPSVGVIEAWQKILPIAKRYKCARVVRHAIHKGLGPGQFSEAHLEEMGQTMIKEGRTVTFAIAMQWRFRKCVHEAGLQSDLPGISPPRRKTLYGIPLSQFPDILRSEVSKLLTWKTDPYVDDRPVRSKSLRPASAARLKEILCQLYGFAHNIKGIQPSTLTELLSQECLGEFLKWSETERKVKISSLVKPLWMIVPIVRDYPLLKDKDFNWLGNRLAAMQARSGSSDIDREEACGVDYDTLARIPSQIRKEAERLRNGEDKKKATLIRDQLLIKLLLVLAWRQRNVRECKLGNRKDGGNIFKEEISPHSRIALPRSAVQALERDPHQKIWQFYFRPEETKAGRAVQAVVAKQLVPLLEEYVYVYRPSLVGNSDPRTLFVNDHGRPFETSALRQRVRNLTARYTGTIVTPQQFRHAFAFKWLKDHPEDYLTLSKHLWHRDVKVTIRVYGSDFDESYAACRVEDSLED